MGKFKKKLVATCFVLTILMMGVSLYSLFNAEPKKTVHSRNRIAYFIQDESGEYSLGLSEEFPKEGYVLNLEKSTCKNGGTLSQDSETKLISMRSSYSEQCTLYFDEEIFPAKETLKALNLQPHPSYNIKNFSKPSLDDATKEGLFNIEDDYGISYFFRGTAPNNYFKFGQNASGQDMWWRIIRINGDGTIRMQYDGAGTVGYNTYTKGFAYYTTDAWNSKRDDAKYAGWMFGGANGSASTSREEAQRNETDSPIKIRVDEWYKKNIIDTGYGDYVADSIFCNDRSIPGPIESGYKDDTGLGYGKNAVAFGAYMRVSYSSRFTEKPQFICLQENDKFTVETSSGGNGALTYPVGLITTDEIVAAGGTYGDYNESYYLYKKKAYWSFTPIRMNTTSLHIFSVGLNGELSSFLATSAPSISPVINIKKEYVNQISGTGIMSDPFKLTIPEDDSN